MAWILHCSGCGVGQQLQLLFTSSLGTSICYECSPTKWKERKKKGRGRKGRKEDRKEGRERGREEGRRNEGKKEEKERKRKKGRRERKLELQYSYQTK